MLSGRRLLLSVLFVVFANCIRGRASNPDSELCIKRLTANVGLVFHTDGGTDTDPITKALEQIATEWPVGEQRIRLAVVETTKVHFRVILAPNGGRDSVDLKNVSNARFWPILTSSKAGAFSEADINQHLFPAGAAQSKGPPKVLVHWLLFRVPEKHRETPNIGLGLQAVAGEMLRKNSLQTFLTIDDPVGETPTSESITIETGAGKTTCCIKRDGKTPSSRVLEAINQVFCDCSKLVPVGQCFHGLKGDCVSNATLSPGDRAISQCPSIVVELACPSKTGCDASTPNFPQDHSWMVYGCLTGALVLNWLLTMCIAKYMSRPLNRDPDDESTKCVVSVEGTSKPLLRDIVVGGSRSCSSKSNSDKHSNTQSQTPSGSAPSPFK